MATIPQGGTVKFFFTHKAEFRILKVRKNKCYHHHPSSYHLITVRLKSLEAALTSRVSAGTLRANLKALRVGIRAASRMKLKDIPPHLFGEEEEV